MAKRNGDEQLADSAVPLTEWAERPSAIQGAAAREIGRMLLDDTVSATDVVTALRPGPPALGKSGEESPILRFRVPEEDRSELRKLTELTHRKQSDLLREGLALVLERYRDLTANAAAVHAQARQEGQFVVALSEHELRTLRELTSRAESHAPTS